MNRRSKIYAIALVACASMPASAAHAEANKVVIGDIDDMSGVYADIIGPGGVEAAKMAIADFGGSVLGKKIELLVTDHQNKPDLGAEKFREWADRDGLTMVLGGSNTGVNIAMATIAREKKLRFSPLVLREHRSPARIVPLTRCIMPMILQRSAMGRPRQF